MNGFSPVATGPAESRSTNSAKLASKAAPATAQVVKKPLTEPAPPVEVLPDKLKLSFASQAKLLRQQGLTPSEIAAKLGVTEQQTQEALESAETLTAALTSALNVKS